MRTGTIALPNGVVCEVEERRSTGTKMVPYYKAPPPFKVWFVVPNDKRSTIQWS